MKIVHVTQAVGLMLGQDLTKVAPEFKGAAFRKGHIIQQEDIPMLLSMGKDHVYIMEIGTEDVHENSAAQELARLTAGSYIKMSNPSEGKVTMQAGKFGLLKIDVEKLSQINAMNGVALSTLHTDTVVKPDEMVASAKIIPLVLPQTTLNNIKRICALAKVISINPLTAQKAGLVVTGNEVFYGRIEDRFESIIKAKLEKLGSKLSQTIVAPDDISYISKAIKELANTSDLVFVTGGMSVDPDDVTPQAVRQIDANIITYGTAVLPGAMFLLAYLQSTPILGIPACGMFSKTTVLDVILPKVLAGDMITKSFIISLGHGGLCRICQDTCHYPNCSFCK